MRFKQGTMNKSSFIYSPPPLPIFLNIFILSNLLRLQLYGEIKYNSHHYHHDQWIDIHDTFLILSLFIESEKFEQVLQQFVDIIGKVASDVEIARMKVSKSGYTLPFNENISFSPFNLLSHTHLQFLIIFSSFLTIHFPFQSFFVSFNTISFFLSAHFTWFISFRLVNMK